MPQGPPARTVGVRLREAREKRGVSLRQIANTTRISVMSLEALERSDLSRLPGGIFTRSFIRAYAQEVGLDPDRTIQDFIAELPPDAAHATAHPVAVEDGEKLESDRKAVTTAVRLILVSAPIIGLVMYYSAHREPSELPSIPKPVVESVVPEVAAAPLTREVALPAPGAAAVPPVAEAAATDLTMEITPRATCWISVNADGERVFSGLMAGGDKRSVMAKEQIVVNVGDAGAFDYTLNGRPGRALGAPGEVVSKRITLSNLSEFVTP
jgi:cytoskeleton protein RodZ